MTHDWSLALGPVLEERILELLARRDDEKPICVSEAAGTVVVTQRGVAVVDPPTAEGPIQVRRAR